MKRGKKFFTYLFALSFCLLNAFVFGGEISRAANEIVCYDRGNNQECTAVATDIYFVVKRYEVLESETSITFPNTAIHNGETYNVEEIWDNAIVVVDSEGNETTTKLNLTSLTLPENLSILENHSLNNIASLQTLVLPNKLYVVGSQIFDNGAYVKEIRLNHYDFYHQFPDGGAEFRAILFERDSFSNITVDRFICGDLDIYDNVIGHIVDDGYLMGVPVTAALTYEFYASEKSIVDGDRPIDTRTYYINEMLTDLLVMEPIPTGLNMTGWYWNSDKLVSDGSMKVVYQKSVSRYEIYPKFELKELTFDISSNQTTARYNAEDDLITMQPTNIQHELNSVAGFATEISWKKGGSDVTNIAGLISLGNVGESGTYECHITYTYTYEGIEYTNTVIRTQEISIIPTALYVEVDDVTTTYGTYLTDADLSYKAVGLIGDDTITSYAYTYNKVGNISAGVYANSVQILIQRIANGASKDVYSNYNIIYTYGDHTISKKDLGEIAFNKTESYFYGEETEAYLEIEDDNVYGQYNNIVKVNFSRVNGNNVGRYLVDGISSIENDNYTATFDNDSIGYVEIFAKDVSINYMLSSNTYDGKTKNADIYYLDIKGIRVIVDSYFTLNGEVVDEVVNAGVYSVHVGGTTDSNYNITNINSLTFTILKATPVVRYSTNQEFTYSGEVIRPVITINNAEQTPNFICMNAYGQQGDYCRDVGVYTVNVNYAESDNYLAYSTTNSQSIRMNVSKYSVNLNPRVFTTYYGESPLLEESVTINGENMLVKYYSDADDTSSIGTYDIIRAVIYHSSGDYEHPNYGGKILLAECTDKVKVVARPVTLHYYDYANLVYDGNVKTLGAYLFDSVDNIIIRDISINSIVDEGEVKNAGTYHISSTISDPRYVITNSTLLEFEVKKGTYDMSSVKFNNAKHVLDFKKHSIELEGELPVGVSVVYTVNGKDGNSASMGFENVVVANFIVDLDNYNPIESMTAIIEIDMSWLIIAIISIIIAAGVGVCAALLYAAYRREHPRKIKLKIKTVIHEDLAAKRVATSIKEVLGDEEEKKKLDEEIAILESEDDLDDDAVDSMTFIERIYEIGRAHV